MLVLQLDQRIEGVARRLTANPLPQLFADQLQRQTEAEHLRHTLDGERRIRAAHACFAAVHSAQREPKLIRIHPRQCRDVAGHLALADQLAHLLMNLLQQPLMFHRPVPTVAVRSAQFGDANRKRVRNSTVIPSIAAHPACGTLTA